MLLEEKVIRYIKRNIPSKTDIKKEFGLKDKDFQKVITKIGKEYNLVHTNKHYAIEKEYKKFEDTRILKDGNMHPTILFMSDTHISDKKCNYELIKKNIEFAYNEGARIIFHSGDITAGNGKVYRGQIHDLEHLTFEQQVETAINTFPYKKDLHYYMINGNHDESHMVSNSGNVGKSISDKREDIHFLGDGYGRMVYNDIKIDLVHLAGGSCYSISYPIQVYLRNFLQGKYEDKPNIVSAGHFHKLLYFDCYGIRALMPGHYQGENSFTKRKGLNGKQGSVLTEFNIINKLPKNFKAQYIN